ncbi:MAG: hypothetical protein CM15mP21_4180 [Hyphomicrobiales bacterium]|nr:MAG: hypothetical protein CM15mP21_4180 [Hyphomicrobiales bacterium]
MCLAPRHPIRRTSGARRRFPPLQRSVSRPFSPVCFWFIAVERIGAQNHANTSACGYFACLESASASCSSTNVSVPVAFSTVPSAVPPNFSKSVAVSLAGSKPDQNNAVEIRAGGSQAIPSNCRHHLQTCWFHCARQRTAGFLVEVAAKRAQIPALFTASRSVPFAAV